jgi:hypothetical protein
MGAGLPPKGGSLHPLAQSRGGGGRDGASGGRTSARRQATYERGNARRRSVGAHRGDGRGCGGGHTGGGNHVRRAPDHVQSDNEDFLCASGSLFAICTCPLISSVCIFLFPLLDMTLFSNDLFDESR